jgi:hypothetical protein
LQSLISDVTSTKNLIYFFLLIFQGRRSGEFYCEASEKLAAGTIPGSLDHLLKKALSFSCKTSYFVFATITASVPEIILYPLTFSHIVKHTTSAAKSGILTQV